MGLSGDRTYEDPLQKVPNMIPRKGPPATGPPARLSLQDLPARNDVCSATKMFIGDYYH